MAKKLFCEYCEDDVEYTVSEEVLNGKVKGETFEYLGKKAFCNKCHEEIYSPELNDYNLDQLYDAYRENHGIVKKDQINDILERYNIGKRPLADLLGWGTLTISRYCDGDLPSKPYSDQLKKIYEDPRYYLDILDKGKDKISETAYKKSRDAANLVFLNNENPVSKIYLVEAALIEKCEDMTHLALQKALYYVQGFYFAFNNTFLFKEDCQAWVHGPVFRKIYDDYKGSGFEYLKAFGSDSYSKLTTDEKQIVDSVIKNVCCYSGKTLESFTHSEMPWIAARKGLLANQNSEEVIPKKLIGDYFVAVKENYKMIGPADIWKYTEEMFRRV